MTERKKVKTSNFFNSNLTATISIALVIFIVGVVTTISLLANEMSNYVKESITFSVVLDDNASMQEVHNLEKILQTAPYVKGSKYISKEEAIKEMAKELGEDPRDFLGFNPLFASIEVNISSEYANVKSMESIERQISKFYGVKDVIYPKNQIESVNLSIDKISIFLLVIAGVLLFISIGLINNTIRLQIYSKRFLINTMKLVGATSWFIRKPFFITSLINGTIASILAILMLAGTMYYIQTNYPMPFELFQAKIIGIAFGSMFVLGILITIVCSLFAIGHYLKIKTNDLYYI